MEPDPHPASAPNFCPRSATRFAAAAPRAAQAILAFTVLAVLGGIAVVVAADASGLPPGGGDDLQLYRTIVDRVHQGESYYDAAGEELRKGGYPTKSVFNWRLPLYAWLLGGFPHPAWGQVFLVAGALAATLMAFVALGRQGGPLVALLGGALLVGAFAWAVVEEAYLSTELWAGVLIACSIGLYQRAHWFSGLLTGLLALFFRELAAPYGVVAAALAWKQGRRWETLGWLIGFALFGLYLQYHFAQVLPRIRADDLAHSSGWIQFGGPAFLISTCRMNAFLRSVPMWLSAVYLPLALLGLAGWRGPMAGRCGWTVAVYLAAFAVVGKPFNFYWGLLYAPLLALGFAWMPAALRDLLRQAGSRPPAGLGGSPALLPGVGVG